MATTASNDAWEKLQTLKNLFDAGFMTAEEYEQRKAQLIDNLTGTSFSTASGTQTTQGTEATRSHRGSTAGTTYTSNTRKHRKSKQYGTPGRPTREGESTTLRADPRKRFFSDMPKIVPRGPPDFSRIEPERAHRYNFDITNRKWSKTEMSIKLDPTPFARGGLRLVYHMQDMSNPKCTYVAKMSMDARDDQHREIYFKDVEMQAHAKKYAVQFNQYNPPKKVDFVHAFNLELIDRENNPVCGVEKYIEGEYRKHNNNHGFVSEEERNTPQAFSHFSWEASNNEILICDVQGVGDLYTDPQVHSSDGKGFGKGNLGKRGIDEFLKSHRCNAICRYLKLNTINRHEEEDGTMPQTTYMSFQHVAVVDMNYSNPTIPYEKIRALQSKPLTNLRPQQREEREIQQSRFDCCNIL